MDFIVTILPFVYLTLILFLLWKRSPFKKFGIGSTWALGIFLFKVIAGLGVWAMYTYYYNERSTADAFRFYDDAKVIHSALFEDFGSYWRMMLGIDTNNPRLEKYIVQMFNWDKEYNFFMYNDNQTMLRFNALCMLLSFGNFHVHTIFMTLFSFTGSYYLYKTFYKFLSDKKYLLLLAVFCIPSVAFFSSGVLKEGIVVGAMGIFIYGIFNITTQYKKPGIWLCLAFGGLLLLIMKIYIIACFIPALLYLASSKWILTKHPWMYFILFNVGFIAGLIIVSKIFPEKDVIYLLYKKRDDFLNVAIQYESGSYFNMGNFVPTVGSFVQYIPITLYTVFFRPYIWEATYWPAKMAAFENMFIVFVFVLRIIFYKKLVLIERRIIYFIITFVAYLYILIGFTTSVFGALVRYKVPALALLLIACLICMNSEKIKKYTPFKHL